MNLKELIAKQKQQAAAMQAGVKDVADTTTTITEAEPVKAEPSVEPESKPKPKLSLLGKPRGSQVPISAEAPAAPAKAAPAPVVIREPTHTPTPVQAVELEPIQQGYSFQERLDELNRIAETEFGINMITLANARDHVKHIYLTLRTEPELDACLLTRDVANIMKVIYRIKEDAEYVIQKTAVKKETKKVKDSSKPQFDLSNVQLPDFSKSLKLDITMLSQMK